MLSWQLIWFLPHVVLVMKEMPVALTMENNFIWGLKAAATTLILMAIRPMWTGRSAIVRFPSLQMLKSWAFIITKESEAVRAGG